MITTVPIPHVTRKAGLQALTAHLLCLATFLGMLAWKGKPPDPLSTMPQGACSVNARNIRDFLVYQQFFTRRSQVLRNSSSFGEYIDFRGEFTIQHVVNQKYNRTNVI